MHGPCVCAFIILIIVASRGPQKRKERKRHTRVKPFGGSGLQLLFNYIFIHRATFVQTIEMLSFSLLNDDVVLDEELVLLWFGFRFLGLIRSLAPGELYN